MGFSLPPPKAPPYDPFEWRQKPWAERLRLSCLAWALDGYGTPSAIYGLYVIKVLIYVGLWVFFCGFNAVEPGSFTIGSWMLHPDAFQKAILWSMAFEGLGLGCASGPLTGRYVPPVAAPWHFTRPGTVKMPLFPGIPILGGTRRTMLDVALYLCHMGFILQALLAPHVTPGRVLPVVMLLGILGLTDKTIFLASRSEHYGAMLVCFLFVDDWIAGAMVVQLAIWIWAAVSKLTRHFPSVISVMMSNSPWLRSARIRKAMFRQFPDDLRPSRLAHWLAHGGTAIEFIFPLLLLVGDGGVLTGIGLGIMLLFHVYITSNIPMAVPIEWNVMVVYGGIFLFGYHADVAVMSIDAPLLWGFLALSVGVVPLAGNLRPSAVSFLMSMRYYAGNWAYSVWLFQGDKGDRLDEHLIKVTQHPARQLARFYDEGTIMGLMGKVPAFRAMHLHGRALHDLLPMAVDDLEAYTYVDGEIVAGMVLGYNFGDGHLHDGRLLAAVQEACGFKSGELRHIFVESQPLGRPALHWQIRDAADGLMCEGDVAIDELVERQPWPVSTGS